MGSKKFPSGGTIIGLAGDVKYGDIRRDAPPTAYFSYRQAPFDPVQMSYIVRATGDTAAMGPAIQSQAAALDGAVPIRNLRTEDDVVSRALYLERTFALLSSCFGMVAVVLACVGLYGTLAYTVSRRTSEIGIRMALGAPPAQVARMVFLQNAAVAVGGTCTGVVAALLASRALASFLYGTSARDPWVFAGSILALAFIASAASLLPAIRAARIQPMEAIRCE
jgi:ABC-type lipoprotein release transport system permease subunit